VTSRFVEALGVNETLCRSLLRAGLTEEDVATRLGLDPKTVRRWMEGKALPYPRHRWALAAMLGTDEANLWPQLRSTSSLPKDVQAVYPHIDTVPHELWLRLFGSAQHEIAILDHDAFFLADDPGIRVTLANRARAGVRLRLCLAYPESSATSGAAARRRTRTLLTSSRSPVALFSPLRETGVVETRLSQSVLYNSVYRGDDQLLVAQYAHNIPVGQAPVIHLHRTRGSGLADTYIRSFDQIWANAQPLT
jgi:transcriptional regulator with XRE-family HTH domain